MIAKVELNTLLVPVDFSENSRAAYLYALGLAAGDGPVVILLHVIDAAQVEFAESHGFGSHDEIVARMRQRAEAELQDYRALCPAEIDTELIISEGRPFMEIARKANDFAVDAIVMSRAGSRGKMEQLMFGSTAEKVLRSSSRPVVAPPAIGAS